MSAAVLVMPSARALNAAWQRYVALVEEQRADERLLTDIDHQMRVIDAHRAFYQAYSIWKGAQ